MISRETSCQACGKSGVSACVKRRCQSYHASYMREWRKKRKEAYEAMCKLVREMRAA